MPPIEVDDLLKAGGFSDKEIHQIKIQHQLLSGTIPSTSERELAAKFCMVVEKPIAELKDVFLSSSVRQEADTTVTQMGWFDGDDDATNLEILAPLKLEPNGAAATEAYRTVKPGSSDLNLSSAEMNSFKGVSSQEQVEQKLREVLLERYNSYRRNGLKGIPPYTRKGGKDYSPGEELKSKSEIAPLMQKHCPIFYQVLNDYPYSNPEGLQEEFTWLNFEIDGKPTIALVHKMGMVENDIYVFCQRHYYVSRGHNSVQGIGGAYPIAPYEGVSEGKDHTLLVYLSRTSTDQVAGFGGSAKRVIGAKIMGGRIAENFERIRAAVEKK